MGETRTPAAAKRPASAPIPPFQAFLEVHRTLVYRFLLSSVGPGAVDDCFQETFLAALRAYPDLEDGRNLTGWILTIATRKAIDAARSDGRRPLPVPDPAVVADPPASEAAAFDGTNPLWRAVRGLPVRQRTALVHRYVLDRPYADIAAAMECTEETARANVYQGLKKLREDWRIR